jgi:hypothetical protein
LRKWRKKIRNELLASQWPRHGAFSDAHEQLLGWRAASCKRFNAPLAISFILVWSPGKVPIGVIDRPKQPTEIRCFLKGPQSVERRAEKPNVILGEEPEGHDAFGH